MEIGNFSSKRIWGVGDNPEKHRLPETDFFSVSQSMALPAWVQRRHSGETSRFRLFSVLAVMMGNYAELHIDILYP